MAEDTTYHAGEWEDRDFMPIRDALIGETDADNYRHVIVRYAFLQEFCQDDKVQSLVSHWAQTTGLEERATRLASAGDRLAQLAGLSCRGELIGREEIFVEDDKEQEAQAAIEEFNAAFDDFMSEIANSQHVTQVAEEAMEFVIGLSLPYPWLAMELIEAFLRAITAFALGQIVKKEGWYEPAPLSEIAAPEVSMSFQTRERESVEEALNRSLDQLEDTLDKLLEPVPPTGKVPDRTIPALERDARWFYRNKVRKESIKAIAIADFGTSDRRKDVYDGIKRAEQLLGLTQYTF